MLVHDGLRDLGSLRDLLDARRLIAALGEEAPPDLDELRAPRGGGEAARAGAGTPRSETRPPSPPGAMGAREGRRGGGGEGPRRWTAEEGRHSIAIRDFLTVTRGVDPVALERGRMDHVSRGYYPAGDFTPL